MKNLQYQRERCRHGKLYRVIHSHVAIGYVRRDPAGWRWSLDGHLWLTGLYGERRAATAALMEATR